MWNIRGNFPFLPSTTQDIGGRRNIDPPCLYPSLVEKQFSLGVIGFASIRSTAVTAEKLKLRKHPHDIIAIFISVIICVVIVQKEGIFVVHITCL